MKKIKKSFACIFMLAMISVVLSSCSSTDAAGREFVDSFCSAFKNMAKEVNNSSSLGDFANIDWKNAIEKSHINDVSDAALKYKLTSSDKKRMEEAIDEFADAVAGKTYEMTGGLVSQSDIKAQMELSLKPVNNLINNSETVGDMAKALNKGF